MKNFKLSILLILIATGLSSCFFGGNYGRSYGYRNYNNGYYRNFRPYNYGYHYNNRPRYYSNPRYDRHYDNHRYSYKKGKRNNDRAYSDNRGKDKGRSRGGK